MIEALSAEGLSSLSHFIISRQESARDAIISLSLKLLKSRGIQAYAEDAGWIIIKL